MMVQATLSRFFASLALIALAAAGCAQYNPLDTRFDQSFTAPYRIDSGDRLRITVYGQTDLSSTYSVDPSGYIAMPLIGTVTARGLTRQELEQSIAKKLGTNFIRNPDVSVELATYRPFFVMGEVRNAGQYPYVSGMTVQTAIAIAGGYSPRAHKGKVLVSRTLNNEIVHGLVPITVPLRPGDTIYVRERLF